MDDDERTIRGAFARLGAPASSPSIEQVLRCHREPHRRYHTVRHLAAVLTTIAELEPHLAAHEQCDTHAVLLAALFHDVVYQPMSHDNEAASAELAMQCAHELGWSPGRSAAVRRLVLATAHHRATTADEALLLDADLAILGAPASQYHQYVHDVRAEYADVPDEAWRRGRAEVLRQLLASPSLYATDFMRTRAEARARKNLLAELATLTDS